MKKLLQRYLSAKTSTKIMLVTVAILAMWAGLFYFGFYRRTIGIVNDRVMDSMMQSIELQNQQINSSLGKMETMSDYIFNNQAFQNYAIQGASTASRIEQFHIYLALEDMLVGIRVQDPSYEIKLYFDKPTLYTSEGKLFFQADSIVKEAWYDDVMKASGKQIWWGFTSRDRENSSEQEAIAVIRALKGTAYSNTSYGILKISLPKAYIQSLMADTRINDSTQCYLLDEGGKVVISTESVEGLPQSLTSPDGSMVALAGSSGSFLNGEGQNKYRLLYREDPRSHWKLVMAVPYSYIVMGTASMSRDGALIFALSFVIILGAALFYSRWLERRIHKINAVIGGIENRSFNKSVKVRYSDELSLVETRINGLVARVEQLLADEASRERAVRQAEFKALQAQINPHFLYNTLDTINWMAVNAGQKDISHAVSRLGRLLRIVLSGGNDMIRLQEEIEYIRLYAEIQSLRSGCPVQLRCDVEQSAGELMIPKLLLQPFVENAILHGFVKAQVTDGCLVLHGRRRQGFARVMIIDNGVGFEDSRLILSPEYPKSPLSGSSYGISNVDQRLKLLFPGGYKLLIKSSPGRGTAICLQWSLP